MAGSSGICRWEAMAAQPRHAGAYGPIVLALLLTDAAIWFGVVLPALARSV